MDKIMIVNGCGEAFIYRLTDCVGSVCTTTLAESLGRDPTPVDFEAEFARLADEADPELAKTIKLVWKAQELNAEDGFVQVGFWHGDLRVDVNCLIYEDEPDKRRRVYELAGQIGAEVLVLFKGIETDRYSHDDGATWIEGPNHGKNYTEYAVSLTPAHDLSSVEECVAILAEQMHDWNR